MRNRHAFRPSVSMLENRVSLSGFDAPAPLLPSEMEQPPLDMPLTTGSSSADGFADSTSNPPIFSAAYNAVNSPYSTF